MRVGHCGVSGFEQEATSRLHIQRRIENLNPDGDIIEDWETLEVVWAAVLPLSGREFWQAAQVQSDVTHKITIRYRDYVTSGHRLKRDMEDQAFNIRSVINVGDAKHVLEMMCTEVT